MMRRRTETIGESIETLSRLEQRYRHQPQELRIKALRLLKENPSRTIKQVADLLGRSGRTLQRWWRTYRQQGLEGLLQVGQAGGKKPIKIGHNGLLKLQERLQKEGFADLKEVQHWIAECFWVDYSLSAV